MKKIFAILIVTLMASGCVNEDPVSNEVAGNWLCAERGGVQSISGRPGEMGSRTAVCKDGKVLSADLYYQSEEGKRWDDPSTITGRDGKKAER